MLRTLSIRNHSLIERLDLELEGGLTVITGETGAGKSIVLDALGLALGDRADSHALRPNSERLEVSAVFELGGTPDAADWLRQRDMDAGAECQLRRVLGRDGRSRAWINGQAATLADLKALGDMLVDLHSQHEHHALLQRSTQCRLLDEFGGHGELVKNLRQAFQAWRDADAGLEVLRASARERHDRHQLLSYQLDELSHLDLGDAELPRLERDRELLAHAAEIRSTLETALALCDDEEQGSALPPLRHACTALAGLRTLGERAEAARQLLESARIQVDEARRELGMARDHVELNPERLRDIEERLSLIYDLARKHRTPAAGLPQLQADLQKELDGLHGASGRTEELEQRVACLCAAWAALASELSDARMRAAEAIAMRVQDQLAALGMSACRFAVERKPIAEARPNIQGAEQIEFLISTNPGTDPAPLARIASGGELSRISLAIQVITASRATTPTVIFDEVDVGIGGTTAVTVGRLLQSLGQRIQVVCVTHLAQVAARGAQHLRASKTNTGATPSATLELLDEKQRVEELARMLGGKSTSAASRAHACEMLADATATADEELAING